MSMRAAFRLRLLCFAWIALAGIPVYGQTEFKKLREFKTTPVNNITLDRLGDIYLILKSDTVRKFDTEGNFMSALSDTKAQPTTLLEPWNPLRVVRYVKARQEVEFYDRFLELQDKIAVDPAWAIEPVLVAPATGNLLWVLDQADWSVSLVDPRTKGVVRQATLKLPADAHPEFVWMREYQNLLFLIDHQSGVLVYNTVGTLVHRVAAPNIEYIGFLGEEFYFLENHVLKFFDLYTAEIQKINVDTDARFVMVTDERMIVVKNNVVEVKEFKWQ